MKVSFNHIATISAAILVLVGCEVTKKDTKSLQGQSVVKRNPQAIDFKKLGGTWMLDTIKLGEFVMPSRVMENEASISFAPDRGEMTIRSISDMKVRKYFLNDNKIHSVSVETGMEEVWEVTRLDYKYLVFHFTSNGAYSEMVFVPKP